MAKQQTITYTDDLGGQGEAHPTRFSFEGKVYEVDLNKRNRDSFERHLRKYMSAGRVVKKDEAAVDYAAVRRWARENNIPVPDRGIIGGETIKAYTLSQV